MFKTIYIGLHIFMDITIAITIYNLLIFVLFNLPSIHVQIYLFSDGHMLVIIAHAGI